MNIEELLNKNPSGLYDFEVVSLVKDMAKRIKDLETKVKEQE